MIRTLLCLPLCLLLAPSYPSADQVIAGRPPERVETGGASGADGLPDPAKNTIQFLEACLKRYQQTVKTGYRVNFHKQERTGGTLHDWETIEACYREQPHAAFFDWQEGARLVVKALYVEGENKNSKGNSQILALPKLLPMVVASDTDSADSKRSGRYSLNQFGLKEAMQRVLQAWKEAAADKRLQVDYDGRFKVQKAGDRICYQLHRNHPDRPEGDDGVVDVTLYIDCETLFQVGTIVRGKEGEILGEYYFRDIRLNPDFGPEQFTRAALKKSR